MFHDPCRRRAQQEACHQAMVLSVTHNHQVIASLFGFAYNLLGWMADPDSGLNVRDYCFHQLNGASENCVSIVSI
jgi:hypothetical protein